MDVSGYFTNSDGAVSFSEVQGSDFAKGVAGDFNPIHDPGSKRFCVPGDLLFTVLLHHFGAASKASVQFSGMLDGGTKLELPQLTDGHADFTDARGRALLSLQLDGVRYLDRSFISQLCERYVTFSGKTFPDILVPLMREAGVMIHPTRPMVIYKDMLIELNELAANLFEEQQGGAFMTLREPLGTDLSLRAADTNIVVDGRKGKVQLCFSIEVAGQSIGSGQKNMVLSGLRDFDEASMKGVVDEYNMRRRAYREQQDEV